MVNKVKKVLGDRVILVKPQAKTSNEHGLRIPLVVQNTGVVKFIGEEASDKAQKMGLEVGQKVIYGGHIETLQVENQDAMSMSIDNVVAILEE